MTGQDDLHIERHYFRIQEHQFRLVRFLDDRAPNGWGTQADLARGLLSFVEIGTSRVLLTARVRLIGTSRLDDRRWTWGWATEHARRNPALVSGFDAMRASSRSKGPGEFSQSEPFVPDGPRGERVLAITSAGALRLWTYYGYTDEVGREAVILGIEACPEVDAAPFAGAARVDMIVASLGAVPFDLTSALAAYLGPPRRRDPDGAIVYPFPESEELRVWSDSNGDICFETQLGPRPG